MRRRDKGKMRVETFEQAQDNPNPDYARIVLPESGEGLEEALDVIQTERRCGKCVHFDYEAGQKALHDKSNPVMLQLIKEHDLASLAHSIDPNQIGACRQWSQGAERLHLVHAITPAKVAKRYTGASTRLDRNKMVNCPDYREVQGKVLRFYKRT